MNQNLFFRLCRRAVHRAASSPNLTALAFLIILIGSIYSNSLSASWHLDDYANITHNPRLRITDLRLATLVKTFDAGPENTSSPYRCLAYLSFALNAYFHQNKLAGYHFVNVTIHIITAFLLFATVLKIFETPNIKCKHNSQAYFVALLTAAFWAANPIQTQAVTYIVQRMTSMAAMFYLLALYLYLVARLQPSLGARLTLFSLCGLSYVCAVFSKENAAMLPVAILFLEFIFFHDFRDPKVKKVFGLCVLAGLLMVLALGTFLFGNPFGFLEGYPYRTFTPAQRLLTEARVLVFYVSQIFYPVPTRLSLYHDFSFSTSLIHPWTTLPCIGFILLLVFIGVYGMGRRPILSFAILFFFINHLIESTVIGLELVFEHRNYLPSLFVFMPISIGIMHITNHYRVSSPVMLRILRTAVVLIIIGFGMGTYVRNLAWADEKTLWEDTLMKSPNSIRAHHELAYQFYEKHGYYDAALALYHRGLDLSGQNIYEKTLSLNNIASIHFTRGEYSQAEAYWERAIASFPGYHKAWYCLSLTQTKMGKWKEAAQNLSTVFKSESSNGNYLQLHGAILLYDNKPLEAIAYFKKVIKLDPSNWKNLICLGSAFDMIGNFDKGYHFLEMANAAHPNDPLIRLLQAQNRLAVGEEEQAGAYLDRFIERVGPGRADGYLRRLAAENKHLSLAVDDIQPKISLKIRIFGDDAIQPSKAARS